MSKFDTECKANHPHLDDPYYYFCPTCNGYEYDCHGGGLCIIDHEEYVRPHERARIRNAAKRVERLKGYLDV